MRLVIDHATFKAAVLKAASAVQKKESRPVLSNLLVEVRADRLRLLGTDLSLGAVVEVPIGLAEPGVFCVPAGKLVEIAKAAPAGNLLLSTVLNELHVHCRYVEKESGPDSKARWLLHLQDADLYPDFPEFDDAKAVRIEREPFWKALQRVVVASPERKDADPRKTPLMGVYLNGGCLYAADNHWAVRELCHTRIEGLMVPIEAADLLVDLLKKSAAEHFEVSQFQSYALFRIDGCVYHAALRDVRFPDMEQVSFRPTDNFARTLLIDRKELIAAIDRASVTKDDKFWLTLIYQNGTLALRTRDNVNDQFVEAIDKVELLGEAGADKIERNVNLKFFRGLISICRNEKVAIRIGLGSDTNQNRLRVEDDGLVAVLQPLRIDTKRVA